MAQELQKYELPDLQVVNIGNANREYAIWEVMYDYAGNNTYYLTDEEKNNFLAALERGAMYVDIKGYILSNKFITIRLCESKYRSLKHPVDNTFSTEKFKDVAVSEEGLKKMREIARQKGLRV